MRPFFAKLVVVGLLAFLLSPSALHAAGIGGRIRMATSLLEEKQRSSNPIPADLLAHAKGVAIFSVTKGGLGIGGLGGEGIVVMRRETAFSHAWTAPSAFNLSGGSIGAQIGFTQAHYIVVLNTDDAVRHFTGSGKLNWDATATGTAGDTTATERASTRELQHREVVVYKDTDGLFGGATLGGTSVERKNGINRDAYGEDYRFDDIVSGKVKPPKAADRLYRLLDGKA